MNEFMQNYGWTIIPWLFVGALWIGSACDRLNEYEITPKERRHVLRLLWITPFWPVYWIILFVWKFIPWFVKDMIEMMPRGATKIKNGFVDAWLPVREPDDPTDETKYERSEETNFQPRLDKHPRTL